MRAKWMLHHGGSSSVPVVETAAWVRIWHFYYMGNVTYIVMVLSCVTFPASSSYHIPVKFCYLVWYMLVCWFFAELSSGLANTASYTSHWFLYLSVTSAPAMVWFGGPRCFLHLYFTFPPFHIPSCPFYEGSGLDSFSVSHQRLWKLLRSR